MNTLENLNYGNIDPHGFYIGKDKFGTNIIVDFDRRSDDKTNSNILILGNSGQGKSYLLKLILTNTRMSGKSVICLDAEQEYEDLFNNLGGCYVDLMTGVYTLSQVFSSMIASCAFGTTLHSSSGLRISLCTL